jgi:hypothetical protein
MRRCGSRLCVLSAVVAAGASSLLFAASPALALGGLPTPGSPLTPLTPSPTFPTGPTVTTAPTQTTSSSGGLSGTDAVLIGIGALVVLGGISLFIWYDARRRAPVRHRTAEATAGGPGGSRPRPKPRKLSPAERRRRKRGRAR